MLLAAPDKPRVEVRSGHLLQLVIRCALVSGLYVFSEQGIRASLVHLPGGDMRGSTCEGDAFET